MPCRGLGYSAGPVGMSRIPVGEGLACCPAFLRQHWLGFPLSALGSVGLGVHRLSLVLLLGTGATGGLEKPE